MTADETPAGARVEPTGEAVLGPASAGSGPASPGATPLPSLLPCPFCGGEAGLLTSIDYGAELGDGVVSAINCLACHARGPGHPGRNGRGPAALAWNKLERLADGLEPEPPAWAKALTAKIDAALAAPPKKAARPDLTIAEAALLVGINAEKARTNCHLAKKGKGDWAGVKVRREGRQWRIEAASFDRLRGAS